MSFTVSVEPVILISLDKILCPISRASFNTLFLNGLRYSKGKKKIGKTGAELNSWAVNR